MTGFGYEIGCFGDLRLQKGGPCFTVPLLSAAALEYADLRAIVPMKSSSIGFYGTAK